MVVIHDTWQCISVYGYEIPFKAPLMLMGRQHVVRNGLIIRLETASGMQYLGEVAPLPGLHAETIDDCLHQLKAILPTFIKQQRLPEDLYPTVRFALDQCQLMPIEVSSTTLNTSLNVNALVVDMDLQSIESQVKQWREWRVDTVKVKIGRFPLDTEIAYLQRLSEVADGKMLLRLDANRCLTVPMLIQFFCRVKHLPLAYFEDPLQTPDAYWNLDPNIPIALDESLASFEADFPKCVTTLVIKPSVVGGIHASQTLMNRARQQQRHIVLTSCFETSIGLEGYLYLWRQLEVKTEAMGFDTLSYLQEDLRGLTLHAGRILCPGDKPLSEVDWNHLVCLYETS